MTKILYLSKDFGPTKLELIHLSNRIIGEQMALGYSLTLRQLYYKLVARNAIRNKQSEYSKMGDLLNDARLAGLVDWDAIVDRTRGVERNAHWAHPMDAIQAAQHSFALDKWEGQDHYVEVWVEKDALVGVVGSICEKLDVPYFSCRGYSSVTALHDAAIRFHKVRASGRTAHILHCGDHDPSGVAMTGDIVKRVKHIFKADVTIHRIALNADQIEEHQLPPNPVKMSDSRAEAYIEEHGESSYELDALDTAVFAQIIEKNVLPFRNQEAWDKDVAKEVRAKHTLGVVHRRWNEVLKLLQTHP